jgi:hypothetical protein
MTYTVPAKTFLIGEYSALVGGSVLGLATGPGFEVQYNAMTDHKFPFHADSPAGKLYFQNKNLLNKSRITLTEKFKNLGGFGKSTAEYLSALIPLLELKSENFNQIRKQYQALSSGSASGADLAIQYFGKVTYFDGLHNCYSSVDWKFKDYDFILVSTGNKLKTHEHVSSLNLDDIKKFPLVSDPIVQLYFNDSAQIFFQGLKEWSTFLAGQGLQSPLSLHIKNSLESNADVICAKPCGAMGADVIMVICEMDKSTHVQKVISEMNLVVQGTSKNLIPGVFNQISAAKNRVGATYVG